MRRMPRFERAHPVLPSSDYGRSRSFYVDVLGFTVREEAGEPPGFGILERDGVVVFVDAFRARPRTDEGDHGWDVFVRVDDVSALEVDLRDRGVDLARPLSETNYGMLELEVLDPDGNRLCFAQPTEPQLRVLHSNYVLAVHDLDRTRDWYERVLGCTSREIDDGGWIFCERDDFIFMIGRCPDAAPASELGDHSYFAYLHVADVDAFAQRAAQEDAEITKPIRTEPWGMRELGLRTPDGHRLMLAQRVHRP